MSLRAPSEKERKKVLEKFFGQDLEVTMAQKLGARTITYDFHCCISADELIQQIYENHPTDNMQLGRFGLALKRLATLF